MGSRSRSTQAAQPELTQDCITKTLLENIRVSKNPDPAFEEDVARAVTGTIYIGEHPRCFCTGESC